MLLRPDHRRTFYVRVEGTWEDTRRARLYRAINRTSVSSIRGRGLSVRYTNFCILLIAPGRRINVSLNGISLLPVRRSVSVPCPFSLVKIINPNGIPDTSRVNFRSTRTRTSGKIFFVGPPYLSRRAIPLVPSRSTLSRVSLRDARPASMGRHVVRTLSIGYRL